jgi:mannan endo-1,4-beta-mannosidase
MSTSLTRTISHVAALGSLLGVAGCDGRYIDIIGRADDPCASLSATECAADTEDGCAFQPNPTGCLPTDDACGAGVCASGDPFVRRSGEALFLHGAPFTFVGTVSWGIAWADNGCQIASYSSQQAALPPTFDELAAMHTSVLRFWAFQAYAGTSGSDFSHFDRLVTAARAAGVRLIPVLENMHIDCSSGDTLDDTWFASGYKSPYGSYTLSYRDYVAGLVAHFRDEPTIMAWELMHEASGSDFSAFDGFTDDMSTLVRNADPNHLIALGLDNGTSDATSNSGDKSNYFGLQNRPELDLIDVHDFDVVDALPTQLARCQAIAHTLGKPIFAGATGLQLADSTAASLQLRAGQLENKLEAAFQANFRGFLVYDYVPGWIKPYYDFDTRAGEPLSGPGGVLDQHAPKY